MNLIKHSQVVSKVLNYIKEKDGYDPFSLVESRQPPAEGKEFKMELGKEEVFQTEFIGASVEECRAWTHQYQSGPWNLEPDLFFIMDERSAKDETLSVQYYNRGPGLPWREDGLLPEDGGPPLAVDEILPQHADTWYTFRIRPDHFNQACADLSGITAPDAVLPFWFKRTAEFTTEDGVFDLDALRQALIDMDTVAV